MKKKSNIKRRLKPTFVFGEHEFFGGKNEVCYLLSRQEVKEKDLCTISSKTSVVGIFFERDRNFPRVHSILSFEDFEKFVKRTRQRVKKYGSCWNHISPDLSVLVLSKENKKK